MQYRTLGRTGIKVSPYALGTMMFATSFGNPDADDSARMLHKALDAGINFIDTADAYGDSEDVVGKALEGRRDDVVLATKFGRPVDANPHHQGASRRWIVTAVENSLRRLRTDHIDLYQVHRTDPGTDIEETLSALTDLLRSGKVRAIGTSQSLASDIVEAQWVAERRGLARFRTEQSAYSILNRGVEREVLPLAQRFGMGTLIWGPLGQGLLTGRVRKGGENDLRRAPLLRHLTDERRLDVVEELVPLAAEAGLPMTHLAMAFVIAHPGVTSALLGPRTMPQLDDLLTGVEVRLTDDILDRIDEIVPPGTNVGALDQNYQPPAVADPNLRRRPLADRAAA
ncbi:aldo/keto reductase [Amycolatopsis nalaikhensis]|uniref:Aldo/keto reductase n=1 Tax=Amycolatopsis nalaikhensis TaxID=715472 RepID=A0ABY8XD73_9PSEU|nr:aldo/keto reductase [Amycolatopsis sp. 2-2]WIV53266.1 aldo/keto reductase [Amycolatopsis sp. 2-2]